MKICLVDSDEDVSSVYFFINSLFEYEPTYNNRKIKKVITV